MLKYWTRLRKSILEKGRGVLPKDYNPLWMEIWQSLRPKRRWGTSSQLFIKLLLLIVGTQLFLGIDVSYVYYELQLAETILHQFIECKPLQWTWRFALTVLYHA